MSRRSWSCPKSHCETDARKEISEKSGGEAAILPNDEDGARPAFDHGPKKQANKAKTTGKKPIQPATRTKGVKVGTPQYHPPTFSPPVQNDSTSWTPFQPTSSTGSVVHLPLQPQPHSYPPAQYFAPLTVPSQLAGASSSFPAHQLHLSPPTFAPPSQISPSSWPSQVPSFPAYSSHNHFNSIIHSIPPVQVPTAHESLYPPVAGTYSRQSGSYYSPPHYFPP